MGSAGGAQRLRVLARGDTSTQAHTWLLNTQMGMRARERMRRTQNEQIRTSTRSHTHTHTHRVGSCVHLLAPMRI